MCLSFLTIIIDLHSNLTLRIQQTALRFYNVFFISIYNYLKNTYICTHKIKIYKISKSTIYLIYVLSELPAVITKINITEIIFIHTRACARVCLDHNLYTTNGLYSRYCETTLTIFISHAILPAQSKEMHMHL